MNDVVQSVGQAVQDFVAPEVRELKGAVKALDVKIDTKIEALEVKLDSFRTEILAALENATLRGRLEDRTEIADLRERVARLEERLAQRH
jgi:hypothetical protein